MADDGIVFVSVTNLKGMVVVVVVLEPLTLETEQKQTCMFVSCQILESEQF